MLIQAFVSKLAVEGLDERILCGFARLSQLQLDIALIGPLIECLASEFGTLVGAHCCRVTAEPSHFIQCASNAKAADAVILKDTHRLLGKVIDHRQASNPPPRTERASKTKSIDHT